MSVTHVGGPTVLIELAGWRILTDPTFDPPGRTYEFGLGTRSTKTTGPAVAPDEVGPVDLILLSHDHHADNLDDHGRSLLPSAGTVLTTVPGARRLRAPNTRGLRPGQATTASAVGRPDLHVLATPCRHGPPLSRPVAGTVIGFAVSLAGSPRTAVWMTGDTVLHRPLRRAARHLDVDVLLLHLGAVRFPLTGPLRYSMNSTDAAGLLAATRPRVVVPVHYEGWSHFSEAEERARENLHADRLPAGTTVTWLERGRAAALALHGP
ncbi:MBL fold metallo-hydrolase [Xylanimonas allomyrinae]|uniref:MBL fold metallo-hydrolase n=1 Tax=Xylanimonas allomyrinae TaxID=2509459 RepID=A0A4P6EQA4_9MICO|nr:MBL fold metallo-hydrolase [Xylanimonas allomyrinae]